MLTSTPLRVEEYHPRMGRLLPMGLFGCVLALATSLVMTGPARADIPSPCTHANFKAPPRLAIVAPVLYAESPLDTDCTSPFLSEKFSAKWQAVAENGAVVDEVWYHTTSNPDQWGEDPAISLVDSVHLGRWIWRPKAGFTDYQPPAIDESLILQEMNTPTTDVRVASATSVTAARSGKKVTVSTRANRYWTSAHAFGAWGLPAGIIQYRVPGTSNWYGLKNVSADAYGRYAYTYTISNRREYRAIMFNARYVWGSTSSNIASS